jgi:hypothetical protein
MALLYHCIFTSALVPVSLKCNWLLLCLNATKTVAGSQALLGVFTNFLNGAWSNIQPSAQLSVDIGHVLRHWANSNNLPVALPVLKSSYSS